MTKTPSSWLWEARNLIVQQYLDSVLKSRGITLPTKVCIVKAMAFHKEDWAPKNWCFQVAVLVSTLESPLDRKEIKRVNPQRNQPFQIHWKDWCWSWISNILVTWWKGPTHWKRPWFWERLRGRSRWDGWMAPLTQWTWVWPNSGRCWRTGKTGMLQSMGSQRVGHDKAAEQQ